MAVHAWGPRGVSAHAKRRCKAATPTTAPHSSDPLQHSSAAAVTHRLLSHDHRHAFRVKLRPPRAPHHLRGDERERRAGAGGGLALRHRPSRGRRSVTRQRLAGGAGACPCGFQPAGVKGGARLRRGSHLRRCQPPSMWPAAPQAGHGRCKRHPVPPAPATEINKTAQSSPPAGQVLTATERCARPQRKEGAALRPALPQPTCRQAERSYS